MKTGWKQGEFILDQVFWFGMTSYKMSNIIFRLVKLFFAYAR